MNTDINKIAARILRQALMHERHASKRRRPLQPLEQWLRDHPPVRNAAKAPRMPWDGHDRTRTLSPEHIARIGRTDGLLD